VSEQYLRITSTVIGVFLVIGMGALARYLKWFTSEVDRSLAGFLSNVLLPAFFFNRCMTDESLSANIAAWTPSFYGFALTILGFVVSTAIATSVVDGSGWMMPARRGLSASVLEWQITVTSLFLSQRLSIPAVSWRCSFTTWESTSRYGV